MRFIALLLFAVSLFAQAPKVQSFSIQSSGDTIRLDMSAADRFQNVYVAMGGGACFVKASLSADGSYGLSLWDNYSKYIPFDGRSISNGLCLLRYGFAVAQVISSSPDGPLLSLLLDMAYESPELDPTKVFVWGVTSQALVFKQLR